MRTNKGSILKASVDYIRKLQKDQEHARLMEEKHRQLQATNRKMVLRLQVSDRRKSKWLIRQIMDSQTADKEHIELQGKIYEGSSK